MQTNCTEIVLPLISLNLPLLNTAHKLQVCSPSCRQDRGCKWWLETEEASPDQHGCWSLAQCGSKLPSRRRSPTSCLTPPHQPSKTGSALPPPPPAPLPAWGSCKANQPLLRKRALTSANAGLFLLPLSPLSSPYRPATPDSILPHPSRSLPPLLHLLWSGGPTPWDVNGCPYCSW